MTRRFTQFAFTATVIALTTINTADAGCHGHGGLVGRVLSHGNAGVSQSYGQNHYNQPAPSYPTHAAAPVVHAQPAYSQPTYSQPSFSQPSFSQPGYAQQGFSQPTYSQPNFPQDGGFEQDVYSHNNGFSQPSYPQQNSYPQQGGFPQQSGFAQQPMPTPAAPSMQSNVVQAQSMAPANANMQPAAPARQPVNAPQVIAARPSVTAAPAGGQAELSALQMLASISGEEAPNAETVAQPAVSVAAEVPEFSAAATPSAGTHVGSWTVNLPGNQKIVLVLNEDSSFNWNASKDGKSSSFAGQYRLEGDRLTLVRSSDLQQMAGSWNGEGANFTFKLDGATTSGMAFSRG